MIVKLEAVNALAQLIAAIGVSVSLFYLAAQIRQNTRSMRVLVDSFDALKDAHRRVEARNLKERDFQYFRRKSKKLKGFIPMSEQGPETNEPTSWGR
jgi:hypothetical protein